MHAIPADRRRELGIELEPGAIVPLPTELDAREQLVVRAQPASSILPLQTPEPEPGTTIELDVGDVGPADVEALVAALGAGGRERLHAAHLGGPTRRLLVDPAQRAREG